MKRPIIGIIAYCVDNNYIMCTLLVDSIIILNTISNDFS